MHWLKENWFKLLIGLFAGFCLLYYFVILPQQKFEYQKYRDWQQQQEKDKEAKDKEAKQELNNSSRIFCLSLAQTSYLDRVKLNATSKDDFATWTWNSVSAREYVENQLKSDKEECYKQNPIN